MEDSQGFLEFMLESVPAMVGYVDREGYYRFVNHRLAAFFGETPESLTGCEAFVLKGRGHGVPRSAFERALAGENVTFQADVTDTGGRELTVENHYYPRIVDGAVAGVCVFAYDVSDRVRAAGALRESREQFRKLIEIIPHGIARVRYGRAGYADQSGSR